MKINAWTAAAVAAASVVSAFVTSTHAADMPLKAPSRAPVVSAAYNWSGFYMGVNAGVGVGRDLTTLNIIDGTFPITDQQTNLSPIGAIGGGQIGYNWQYNNIVLGFEADIQASGQRDDATCLLRCNTNFVRYEQNLDWFGTARGRVGLATGPVLSYITAGFAYARVETTLAGENNGNVNILTENKTRTGFVIGSGVEASLGGNWTGKLEYLFINLGNTSQQPFNFVALGQTGVASFEIRDNIFRAGLNYRFGHDGAYALAPAANWGGFYVGGNVGGGIARNVSSLQAGSPPRTEPFTLVPDGFIGGGQIGYNWQAGAWVFGAEADLQATTVRDDKACVFLCTSNASAKFDQQLPWFGTVRARLGHSFGSTLVYGTAGYAYGENKTQTDQFNIGSGFASVTLTDKKGGWTAGGGIESPLQIFGLFGPNWTVKTEYLYVDLGRSSFTFVPFALSQTFTTETKEHIIRTGINYRWSVR